MLFDKCYLCTCTATTISISYARQGQGVSDLALKIYLNISYLIVV